MIKDLIKTIEKISHKRLNVKLSSTIPDERCIWTNNSKTKKILKFTLDTDIEDGLRFTISHGVKK